MAVKLVEITLSINEEVYEQILKRAKEVGFNDVPTYMKVLALTIQPFNIPPEDSSSYGKSIDISFDVTEAEAQMIHFKMISCGIDTPETFFRFIATHGVLSATIEIDKENRDSSADLDAMLERIQASKQR